MEGMTKEEDKEGSRADRQKGITQIPVLER
jgi:hypothetical protein